MVVALCTCGELRELWGRHTSCGVKLACILRSFAGSPGQHTCYELKRLRYHLLAILVVRHDCGRFRGVERGGAAGMAGGRRKVVSEDVRMAMG